MEPTFIKIPDLLLAGALQDSDLIPIEQAAGTRKLLLADLKAETLLTQLVGFVPSNAAIDDTVSVFVGLERAQGQINNISTTLSGKQDALGYVPVNKSGDTGLGSLLFQNNKNIDTAGVGDSLSIGGVNAGTGNIFVNASVLNIGTGSGAKTINIGSDLDTIIFKGAVVRQNEVNLAIEDKLITLNVGGLANTGYATGFEIEAGGVIVGYIKTTGGADGWLFRSPQDVADTSLFFSSTLPRSIIFQDADGTVAYLGDIANQVTHSGSNHAGSVAYFTSNSDVTSSSGLNYIDASTFLGIGTATQPEPGARFSAHTGSSDIIIGAFSASAPYMRIAYPDSAGANGGILFSPGSYGSWSIGVGHSGDYKYRIMDTRAGATRDQRTRFIVDEAGNSGFGTVLPNARIEARTSSTDIAWMTGEASNGGYILFRDEGIGHVGTRGFIGYGTTVFSNVYTDFGIRSQAGLALAANGGTVYQYINTTGQVGWGDNNVSPSENLHYKRTGGGVHKILFETPTAGAEFRTKYLNSNGFSEWRTNTIGGNDLQLIFDNGDTGVYFKANGVSLFGSASTSLLYEQVNIFGGARIGLAPATLTTLSANITNSDATIAVASTTNYPHAGTIVIDSEAITYTGISGNNFTGCSRGALGTTAASHLSAASVNNYLLGVAANSTKPKFVVLGNGFTGLGDTPTPSTILEVTQSGVTGPHIKLVNKDGTSKNSAIDFFAGTTPVQVWSFGAGASGLLADDDMYLNNASGVGGRVLTIKQNGCFGLFGVSSPVAGLHLPKGTNTIPSQIFDAGGMLTGTALAGSFEYDTTFYLSNSDAVRRSVVLAPTGTKIAGVPVTDGYMIFNIKGTDFKFMTTT